MHQAGENWWLPGDRSPNPRLQRHNCATLQQKGTCLSEDHPTTTSRSNAHNLKRPVPSIRLLQYSRATTDRTDGILLLAECNAPSSQADHSRILAPVPLRLARLLSLKWSRMQQHRRHSPPSKARESPASDFHLGSLLQATPANIQESTVPVPALRLHKKVAVLVLKQLLSLIVTNLVKVSGVQCHHVDCPTPALHSRSRVAYLARPWRQTLQSLEAAKDQAQQSLCPLASRTRLFALCLRVPMVWTRGHWMRPCLLLAVSRRRMLRPRPCPLLTGN